MRRANLRAEGRFLLCPLESGGCAIQSGKRFKREYEILDKLSPVFQKQATYSKGHIAPGTWDKRAGELWLRGDICELSSIGDLENALLDGNRNRFGAIGNVKFAHNALQVVSDSIFTDRQCAPDLLIG